MGLGPAGLQGELVHKALSADKAKWDLWPHWSPGEVGPQGEMGPQGPLAPREIGRQGEWGLKARLAHRTSVHKAPRATSVRGSPDRRSCGVDVRAASVVTTAA